MDKEIEIRRLQTLGNEWLDRGAIPNFTTSTTTRYVRQREWDMAMWYFDQARRLAQS